MTRLYGRRWGKARLWFLRRNPMCVMCQAQGVTELATVVDHIEPHRGDRKLFWDAGNWQALCKRCHDSTKQKEEKAGQVEACDADGYPTDIEW